LELKRNVYKIQKRKDEKRRKKREREEKEEEWSRVAHCELLGLAGGAPFLHRNRFALNRKALLHFDG